MKLLKKEEKRGISIPLKEKEEFCLAQNEKEEKRGKRGTAEGLKLAERLCVFLHKQERNVSAFIQRAIKA